MPWSFVTEAWRKWEDHYRLTEEQKAELKKAADNAKVNIDKMIPQDKSVEVSPMPA